MVQAREITRRHSLPALSPSRALKLRMAAAPSRASLTGPLENIDNYLLRDLTNQLRVERGFHLPGVASDAPSDNHRHLAASTTAATLDSIRRVTRDTLELLENDFHGTIRRAEMVSSWSSSERAAVVLASPVVLPARRGSGMEEPSAFEVEFDRLAVIEHPHLLKPVGLLEWDDCEPFVAGEGTADEATEQTERARHVTIVWEGRFDDNLSRFAEKKTPKEVFAVLCAVALGLVVMHSKGVAHGNVCCENIVISGDGLAKLGDFKLCSSLEVVRDPCSDRVAAPELIVERWKSGECTRRSVAGDVFSLAMAAVVALCGELPFELKDEEEILEELQTEGFAYPRPVGFDATVWARLSPMLSTNPEARPDMEQAHAVFHALSVEDV
jgi:hypothetical protein